MTRLFSLVAAATALVLAVPAQAVTLRYIISGFDTLADNQVEFASFRIDSNPVPDGYDPSIGFFVAAVPGTYTYGTTTTTTPQDITFYLADYDGSGLFVGEGDLLGLNGPQLFTGPVEQPTLRTGNFTLTDYFTGSPISLTVTAVPEPATWAFMLAGFAAVGGLLRHRRTVVALD